MDQLLGEMIEVQEVQEKDLIWEDKAFRAVVKIAKLNEGQYVLHTIDGYAIHLLHGDKVLRGHYFLVARRID